MSQPSTEDMDSFLMSEEHLNSKPPKLNTDVLEEILYSVAMAGYRRGKDALNKSPVEVVPEAKQKIQQLYILKSDSTKEKIYLITKLYNDGLFTKFGGRVVKEMLEGLLTQLDELGLKGVTNAK